MHVDHGPGRDAFVAGLRALMAVAGGLDDQALLATSRCRGWTVGDLLVHVHLGLQEMLLGVVSAGVSVDAAPAGDVPGSAAEPDTDAASYWRSFPPVPDGAGDRVADQTAHVRFVRLLAAAYRRPTGLVAHLRPTADGLAAAVGAMAPGVVPFQGHALASGDFLATWAVELAVHHLDLGRELTLPAPDPAALTLARATVEALAGGPLPPSWQDETAVLVGTGRIALDPDLAAQAGALADRLPVLG